MERDSQNTEKLLEDGSEGLEFDSNDLEIDGNDLGIEGNELDIEHHGLVIEDDNIDMEENTIEIEGQELDTEGNGLETNCEQLLNLEDHIFEDHKHIETIVNGENGELEGKNYPVPVVGMEFESYDEAYNYYNCYAKDLGFAIRVKSSWTKRNSKEKRGAVLCCNCEGFKTVKEANSRRKETRTGCLAMVRLRLVETNMWRVDEVKLEHNHSFDPERAQNSKSHKKMDAGAKRKEEPNVDVEVQTIKLYRTSAVDSVGYSNFNEGESQHYVDSSRRLKFEKGDTQALNNFFCRCQQRNPNFFYVMDLNDEGYLRNVFWVSSRSKAAYGYFGDVVIFDTTCLSNKYDIPLCAFVGVNHHGQTILLGCGFVAEETVESYVWLFRAWLTYILGHPPQTIITDQCKSMQSAIAEVFPRARHHFCLSYVTQRILENLVALQEYEAFKMVLISTVYDCLKVDEFEMAWDNMIHRFGVADHEWLKILYEDRERWAPVYAKDTFFAGMSTFQKGETMISFFDGNVYPNTSLKEFLDMYELIIEKKHRLETVSDHESRDSTLMLRTNSYFELQLSKIYTNEIFRRFQDEVVMMASCFNPAQVNINGQLVTYIVKEQCQGGDIRDFEVMYDKTGEVRCICGCFNLNGYLCRHALCVLQYNGLEEIPYQYILTRWRKDFKRIYVPELGPNNIDITNPVQWFDHLYRRAMQVVEEGMISQDHYMVAWQAFKEALNKVRLAGDKQV